MPHAATHIIPLVETSALPRLLRGYAVETPFKRVSSSAWSPLCNATLGQRPYMTNAMRVPKSPPLFNNQILTRYTTAVPDYAGAVVAVYCGGHEACSRERYM